VVFDEGCNSNPQNDEYDIDIEVIDVTHGSQ
jgi:hypothetical protein